MRNFYRRIRTSPVALLGAATIAAFCFAPQSAGGSEYHRLDTGRTAMAGRMGTETVSQFAVKPSIDVSAPKGTRTATFGMG
jgi:hypothetical protein